MTETHEFTAKAKAQLDEWDAQIAQAEGRMKQIQTEGKAELQEQIDEMRAARSQAQERIDALQAASDEAWNDLQSGSLDAWRAIEDALNRASDRFAKQS